MLLPSKAQIVCFWGPELVTLYNDAYRPVFGGKHPSALGKPAREAWSEIWEAGLRQLLEGVLESGEAYWAQDRLFVIERHGYVEETYFDVSYDPVRDESGTVRGVFCIVSETTGRVLGERRLATLRDLAARTQSTWTLDAVSAAARDAIASNPKDLPFAALYLGRASDGPPALQWSTTSSSRLSDVHRWPWADVLASNELRVTEIDGVDARFTEDHSIPPLTHAAVIPLGRPGQVGATGMLVAGISPLRPFDEDYRGFLGLIAGQIAAVVANAQQHQEEHARTEALAQLDRAKTVFFSNVSHEFRTPLTLMLGPLEEALAQSEQLQRRDRERLALAHRNAIRLLRLVNTLLDFARIEAGRIDASYWPTDLGGFTAELASMFRSAMDRAGLRLVIDSAPLDGEVLIDRDMWEKIVFNLLSNAFKFTFDGGVEVAMRRVGDQAVLTVRDSGIGISADEIPRLFERFHRVKDARGRTFEGSGIGLALVHELVKLHGGSVSVSSQLTLGSTFTVSIPIGRAHLPADRIEAPRSAASTAIRGEAYLQELLGWLPAASQLWSDSPSELETVRNRADSARILLADDNADMREYLSRVLGERYAVEAVRDGAAALKAARAHKPDLIVTDVMMPELDGFGLLRELRSDERLRAVPVVMLSARAAEESRVEGMSAGADDYLAKPFSARELLARVSARLELSRMRARVEETQSELAELFAQTPVPTAVLRGPELVFEAINPAYRAVTGNRAVPGLPLHVAMPELAEQGVAQLLLGVLQTGIPHVGRERLLQLERGGSTEDTHWNFVYAPLREPDGTIDRVIVICNEVTAEVRAREVIEKEEARYRNIFENAGVSIWEEDFSAVKTALDELTRAGVRDYRQYLADHPEFVTRAIGMVRVVDVNDNTLRLFGATTKGQLTESLQTVFLPETVKCFAEELVAIAEGAPVFQAETVARTLKGAQLDVLFTLSFPKSDPRLQNVLVTMVDISERKRAERALVEDARTLETLNHIGTTLAADLDLERVVQAVTDAATELSGARYGAFFYNIRNEAGDSYLLHALSGAPREAFERPGLPRNSPLFAATFEGQGMVRLDDVTKVPRYGKNSPLTGMSAGELPVRSYLAVPVTSRSGEVLGGLFFGHPDVGVFTERAERMVAGIAAQAAVAIDNARLYDQGLQLIEKLQGEDRRKNEFLATLSHELRNPLAPLRNSLHLLRLSGHSDPALSPVHEMMERQLNHLVRLVDDLLEVSRISRGTFALRRERVELASIVHSAIETSQPLIQQANHSVRVSVPEQSVWIDGDPIRLAQIVSNLLNNAAKYTDPGGVIEIDARSEGASVGLTVRDNGVGITPASLPRVFEMFSRGDAASGRDRGGLGIGLALSRKLAEMHGGTITARSAGPGLGSEFTVQLPLTPDQDPGPKRIEFVPAPLPSRRVLVVDDNQDSAESLSMLLTMLGADVKVALDGPSALVIFESHTPEIVLLDIGMPSMDGYEVARRLRTSHPARQTTIVALTGWGQEEDRRLSREAGFDRHLTKPADVTALQDLLAWMEHQAT